MENICILDTETTGIDPHKGNVIEIAVVFFNIPTRSIIHQASTLLYAERNEAYEINKIDVESLKRIKPIIQSNILAMIHIMMNECDAIIAHNASFDKKWIETLLDFQEVSKNKKWICTKNDVKWPIPKSTPLNLIHICVALGVPIVNSHRALADCLLLCEAIKCVDDIDFFLDKSGAGLTLYYANIRFEERDIVKNAGFQWDNSKKVWYAKMTPAQATMMPFPVYPAEEWNPVY